MIFKHLLIKQRKQTRAQLLLRGFNNDDGDDDDGDGDDDDKVDDE